MSDNKKPIYKPTGSHDHYQIQVLKDHISNPRPKNSLYVFSAAKGRNVRINTPTSHPAKFLLFPNDLYPNDGTKGPYNIGSLLVTKTDNDGKPKEWIYRAKLSIDGSPDDPQTTIKYLFSQAVDILITNGNMSPDYTFSNIDYLEKELRKNNDFPMKLFITESRWALFHKAKNDYNAPINIGLNQVLQNQESHQDRLHRVCFALQGALITLGLQSTAIETVRGNTEQIIEMQRRLHQLVAEEIRNRNSISEDGEACVDSNNYNNDIIVGGEAGICKNNLQQQQEMAAGIPVPESTSFGNTINTSGDVNHAIDEDSPGDEGNVELDDDENPGLIGPGKLNRDL